MISSSSEPDVSILCEGYVVRENGRVVEASSTVVLIRAGEEHIIVDTGSSARLSLLRQKLDLLPLAVDEVQMVVNTHLHADHCGGNDLFTGAVPVAHSLENPPMGTRRVAEGDGLMKGVDVMETPGHTLGSITILVDADRRYAICGDAIPTKANYDTNTPPAIHVDRRLAIESMDRILTLAEVVVPGHDAPFLVMGKR